MFYVQNDTTQNNMTQNCGITERSTDKYNFIITFQSADLLEELRKNEHHHFIMTLYYFNSMNSVKFNFMNSLKLHKHKKKYNLKNCKPRTFVLSRPSIITTEC